MERRLTRRELLRRGAGTGIGVALVGLTGIDALADAVATEANARPLDAGVGSCADTNVFYGCKSTDQHNCSLPFDCPGTAQFDCHLSAGENGVVVCRSYGTGTFHCINPDPGGGWSTAYRCSTHDDPPYKTGFECMPENPPPATAFQCGNGYNDQAGWEFYCNTAPNVNLFQCNSEGIVPKYKFRCNDGEGSGLIGDYKCNSTSGDTDYSC